MSNLQRSYANLINEKQLGKAILLQGWVHRRRDHGGIIFLDMRDHTGLVQVVAEPDNPYFKLADSLRLFFSNSNSLLSPCLWISK